MTIGRILVGLAVAAIMAVWILVPTAIYRSGSAALPAFTRLVTPGPLSASHAFVEASCESCHAPHRGVAESRCIA
ncbi:MAG: class III cytochrome C family protein, partial [Alphaproteobacteria bacterium]|nr:class III cytochrome C family protein [Alphaproteobacteria bacterium]